MRLEAGSWHHDLMATRVTATTIARLRLASQFLLPDASRRPAEVVRRLTAMQAQDLGAALWAVGVRAQGSGLSDVQAALTSGEIVRSWPMRGTLHLVAAEDLRWMLGLSTERSLRRAAARHRQLGIDADSVAAVRDIAVELLAGGGTATREQLFGAFEAAGQDTKNQRGIHLLWILCQTGALVQGPMQDGKQHFVLFDEWIRFSRPLEGEEALAEFALRYVRGHGPATEADFAWWTKLPLADARRGIAAVRQELLPLETAAGTFWMAAEAEDLLAGSGPGARSLFALPGFDEILLGYADRRAALPDQYAERIVPGGNGVFKPTILAGGTVVGTWKRRTKGSDVIIEPQPFEDPGPAALRSFERIAEQYRRFLRS